MIIVSCKFQKNNSQQKFVLGIFLEVIFEKLKFGQEMLGDIDHSFDLWCIVFNGGFNTRS
jgi:hypothetical protein